VRLFPRLPPLSPPLTFPSTYSCLTSKENHPLPPRPLRGRAGKLSISCTGCKGHTKTPRRPQPYAVAGSRGFQSLVARAIRPKASQGTHHPTSPKRVGQSFFLSHSRCLSRATETSAVKSLRLTASNSARTARGLCLWQPQQIPPGPRFLHLQLAPQIGQLIFVPARWRGTPSASKPSLSAPLRFARGTRRLCLECRAAAALPMRPGNSLDVAPRIARIKFCSFYFPQGPFAFLARDLPAFFALVGNDFRFGAPPDGYDVLAPALWATSVLDAEPNRLNREFRHFGISQTARSARADRRFAAPRSRNFEGAKLGLLQRFENGHEVCELFSDLHAPTFCGRMFLSVGSLLWPRRVLLTVFRGLLFF
jgi:hypothetical protein